MRHFAFPLSLVLLCAAPVSAQMMIDNRMHCTTDGKICVPKAPVKDSGIRYNPAPHKPAPIEAVVETTAAHAEPDPKAAPHAHPAPPKHKPKPRHAAHVTTPPQPMGPPKVGQVARNLRGFEQAQRSRFAPPPAGQEYWVVNDHLVLLRQSDKQITSVLGLVDHLIK